MSTCQSNPTSTLTVSLREMRMVFERSTRAAWAFPSAQEQAALYSR